MMTYPHYTVGYKPRAPMIDRITPQPTQPIKIIESNNGIVTSAEAVYRMRYVDRNFSISLLNGRQGLIVSMKPAKGELIRHPTKFDVVLWNDETKHREELVIRAWQPLKVI